ncbi:hypothetical protein E4T66_17870 [Sinimarinibacterium sp. CAU 1509]|uniref:hypothetical protein n=1 Tax=Sinimarinibacterium sp. CAU 1509 TaxID=2562283 RepID=UPI0010ABEB94|nr:hypothetical protein [Sinimarinibacterium sp. CAU 1509]TJY57274.1 hypothetical protein E4T66_17870 [Sinimarinibacterium sp. CAU 1509]
MKSKVVSEPHLAEWLGAAFGVGGTLLAAVSAQFLFFTFSAYAVSNVSLIYAARVRRAHGLLAMNAAYFSITLFGLYNHFPGGGL